MSPPPVTRLAPSPTGALHLGNARTFLVNWALARREGWRIVMRVEDLDTPRNKAGAAEGMLRTLGALGIDWDEGPFVQTEGVAHHRDAMRTLARAGAVYPCALTRSQIEAAASAPQGDSDGGGGEPGGESRFPASLRPSSVGPCSFEDERTNWRFATPERAVEFEDRFAGPQRHEPWRTVGDFVVWTARGQPSYQLAVVVDDERQGVTHIVRGDDLLDSAARQMLLREALGIARAPAHYHLPLVKGPDGRRLAKRHGDTRVDSYLSAGVRPERIIGLAAWWCGASASREEASAAEFLQRFDPRTMSRSPITFTEEDHAWLLNR